MTAEIGEEVIGLGVLEAEFEIRKSGNTPSSAMLAWELRGEPELEDLRFTFESFVIHTVVGGCKPRYVYALTFVVLADALGEEILGLVDLKGMVGSLVLGLLFVPQLAPEEQVSMPIDCRT